MTMGLDLIACCRARVTDFSDNGDPDKLLQDAIYGGPGNLWHSPTDVVKDLVGGGVIRSHGQGFENHSSLNGEGQRMLAASLRELLQLETGSRARSHVCNFIASGKYCQYRRCTEPQ